MGETQGSMWTTGLFIILFFGMVTVLFWALDIMRYNSTIYTIEDNLKAENYDIFSTLSSDYNVCGVAYDTTTDCSGIVAIDEERRIIKYQLSFNGLIMEKNAGTEEDHIVMLPY